MRMTTGGTINTINGYFVSLYLAGCVADKRSGVITTAMIITLSPTRGTENIIRSGIICIGTICLIIIIAFNHLKTLA